MQVCILLLALMLAFSAQAREVKPERYYYLTGGDPSKFKSPDEALAAQQVYYDRNFRSEGYPRTVFLDIFPTPGTDYVNGKPIAYNAHYRHEPAANDDPCAEACDWGVFIGSDDVSCPKGLAYQRTRLADKSYSARCIKPSPKRRLVPANINREKSK